jgi:CPA2 family monovalent cation:H+ antiporter-2
MPDHQTPLLAIIAAGLMLAFLFGLAAQRLRLQPIVGYLLAGIVAGPYTPGFAADPALAGELAEIGVILLMFGVGLHFSLKDLISVARIAVPGAIAQITVATLMGMGLAHLMGWSLQSGLVFGLALSVASTVVCIRALQENHILDTDRGRIAVGWLVLEDLAMVLALVLVPAAALMAQSSEVPPSRMVFQLLITLAKVVIFIAVMLVVGRRLIPWLMHHTARTGSRELFRLFVYSTALGIAFCAAKLSASRSRSVPSLPAWYWAKATSVSARPRRPCRCAMRSPCCSSCRSACFWTPLFSPARRLPFWPRSALSCSASRPRHG